jgi:hypothetical protein
VGHVEHGGAAAGEEEREPVVAVQAELLGLRPDPGGELGGVGATALVEVLDDELLAAVDLPRGQPARQAGLPGERGVAAGVDEAGGGDLDGAVAGGEADGVDPVRRRSRRP